MSAKHELEIKNLIYLLELLCFLIYIRVQINNLLFQLLDPIYYLQTTSCIFGKHVTNDSLLTFSTCLLNE